MRLKIRSLRKQPPNDQLTLSWTYSCWLLLTGFKCLADSTLIFPVFLFFCSQGDVWICMELMDTSLDKFYKKVIEKGKTIPEDILGKITVAVRDVLHIPLA